MKVLNAFSKSKAWSVLLLGLLCVVCVDSLGQEAAPGNTEPELRQLISLTLAPSTSTVHMSTTQGLRAVAGYSDGSVQDVTAQTVWNSQAPMVAAVVAHSGVVTGVSTGTASVMGTFGGKTGVASVTVSAATLESIDVLPTAAMAQVGGTTAFVAKGTYSDGSTADLHDAVRWWSATPDVVDVESTSGLATVHGAGSAVVRASLFGKMGSAVLVVPSASAQASTVDAAAMGMQPSH